MKNRGLETCSSFDGCCWEFPSSCSWYGLIYDRPVGRQARFKKDYGVKGQARIFPPEARPRKFSYTVFGFQCLHHHYSLKFCLDI